MTGLAAAFVLAAGLGTRMQSLTGTLPKPLIELGGKALIDHVLDRLADAGVQKAVVNVHHLADKIEVHLAGRRRPRIVISDERDKLLDTGGGVARALDLLGPESFFIHNSDSVWIEGARPALEEMTARWDAEAMDALLLLAAVQGAVGYSGDGDFMMNANGLLKRRQEGEVAPFLFAGVSIVHPRLFEDCPEGAFSLNWLWDRAAERERLYGMRHDGIWMHVGDPQALKAAEETLKGTDDGQ
jgi:MurNAc alpha-1-phosphate uridylyltransferase